MDPSLIHPSRLSWDRAAAFGWCMDLARQHYENFPVASLFIPRSLRPSVAAVYAFARIADDIADEPGPASDERLSLLREWESKLLVCTSELSSHPVFVALGETIRSHSLPLSSFRELLSAFRQDVTTNRYESFEEVEDYCRRSANPVGRIILRLFGHADDAMFRESDAICTALQLTNFWQDFSQDLSRGRIYVPQEDYRQFGVGDPFEESRSESPAFRRMMAFQVKRTRRLFEEGKALPGRVKSPLSWQLRLTWNGGVRVLDKIERSGYTVVRHRPRLNGFDAAVVALRSARPG